MSTTTDSSTPAAPPPAAPRPRRPRPQVMTVTPAAAERVKALIDGRGKPTAGIRIGVRTKGCSGMSYTLEFADKQEPMDEVVETGGIKLLIDPKASLFLIGTEMDYEEEKLKSGFVFRNPNEKGRCGCGESFHVGSGARGPETVPLHGQHASQHHGPAHQLRRQRRHVVEQHADQHGEDRHHVLPHGALVDAEPVHVAGRGDDGFAEAEVGRGGAFGHVRHLSWTPFGRIAVSRTMER